MIYFDNASTTKPYDAVLDTYLKYAKDNFYNPSSNYKSAKLNAELIEKIKQGMLKILDLTSKKIIFTSSATEANNLAIIGYLSDKFFKNYHLITTEIEHKSVLSVFKYLETKGFEVTYLKVNKDQQIDLNELENSITSRTIFASIMAVNNETGGIINIGDAFDILKKHNIMFHSDFSQALFKIEKKLNHNANMITISSHKLHGLKSIAALIIDKSIELKPLLIGGGQEYGMRSSTLDFPLIASFYKTLEINNENYLHNKEKIEILFDHAFKELSKRDYLVINSLRENNTKYILNFSLLKNIKASVIVEALSKKEIFVSTTSACNSKKENYSYVINSIYSDIKRASNCIRLSFSEDNTKEEIDAFIKELDKATKQGLWSI